MKDNVPEVIISAVSWVWCYTFCAYFGIAFILLSFENAHKVYSSMYYTGHIVLITLNILLSIAPKSKSKTTEGSNNEKNKKVETEKKAKSE